jgi:hypothetical protein
MICLSWEGNQYNTYFLCFIFRTTIFPLQMVQNAHTIWEGVTAPKSWTLNGGKAISSKFKMGKSQIIIITKEKFGQNIKI